MKTEPSKPLTSEVKLARLIQEHYSKERTTNERLLFIRKLKLNLCLAYIEMLESIHE